MKQILNSLTCCMLHCLVAAGCGAEGSSELVQSGGHTGSGGTDSQGGRSGSSGVIVAAGGSPLAGASAGGVFAESGGSKAGAGGSTRQGSGGGLAGTGGWRLGTGGNTGQTSGPTGDAGSSWIPGQVPPEVYQVAEPVCVNMCNKLYAVACSPLHKDMGCVIECVGSIAPRWARCPTEVPALLKCRGGAPDSYSFSCDSSNKLVATDTTCKAEAQALAACP